MFGDLVRDAGVQLGEFGPVHPLAMVVGCVIAEIAREQVERGVHDVVARLKAVFRVEPCVMIVGGPGRKRETDQHGQGKDEEPW